MNCICSSINIGVMVHEFERGIGRERQRERGREWERQGERGREREQERVGEYGCCSPIIILFLAFKQSVWVLWFCLYGELRSLVFWFCLQVCKLLIVCCLTIKYIHKLVSPNIGGVFLDFHFLVQNLIQNIFLYNYISIYFAIFTYIFIILHILYLIDWI